MHEGGHSNDFLGGVTWRGEKVHSPLVDDKGSETVLEKEEATFRATRLEMSSLPFLAGKGKRMT